MRQIAHLDSQTVLAGQVSEPVHYQQVVLHDVPGTIRIEGICDRWLSYWRRQSSTRGRIRWSVLRPAPVNWPPIKERFSLSPTLDVAVSWSEGMIVAPHVVLAIAVISPVARLS